MGRTIYCIKRDGIKVNFDSSKISAAIMKAVNKVYNSEDIREFKQKMANNVADTIEFNIKAKNIDCISVEEIQDLVEEQLMIYDTEVAKEYILYRNQRSIEREKNSAIVKRVVNKIASKNIINSNANVDEKSFSGREKEAASELSKTIAIEYEGLDKEVANAHKEMIVYQHDLEKAVYGIHNCLNLNFQEIFTKGFSTRNGDVRPPASFSTACQLVAVAFQCQSQVC